MLAVIIGANFYVVWRLWHMIPPGNVLRWVVLAVVATAIASFFLSILAGNSLPALPATAMYKLGTAWFFVMFYFLILFLVMDIVRLTHLTSISNYMFGSWTGLAVAVGIVTVVMTLGYVKYCTKQRVEITVATAKTAGLQQPLKILALSDLHLGYGIGRKEFEGWVRLINRENPDVVLIAGDIVDNNLKPLRESKMEDAFKSIHSKYGVFAAPGNHEYISGIANSMAFLEDAGVTVLRDSAALVAGGVYIVGRDDRTNSQRKPLAELLHELDRSKPAVVLDHQPYELEMVEKNNVDLQISGHTHRGQIWPISWITDAMYEKSHGYLQKGGSHIFVSSGMGIWGGKFRIGTQSEYIVINLIPEGIE